jgi:hypothetical protein
MAIEYRLPRKPPNNWRTRVHRRPIRPVPVLKANQPPPEPHTAEAVARRLARALGEAGRGPAKIPQVYALLLLGWIRNYQARLDGLLEELNQDDPPETRELRQRWAQSLREVFDPARLEKPIRVELPEYQPEPDPVPTFSEMRLNRNLERFLARMAKFDSRLGAPEPVVHQRGPVEDP